MLIRLSSLLLLAPLVLVVGCGDDEPPKNEEKGCSIEQQTGCGTGLVCEAVEGADPACFAPLFVRGRVFDSLDDQPIEGARVIARDPNDAALSRVAISAADGTYELQVAAKRDASGAPVKADVTLRADAMSYDTFPRAPRVAIPIDLATAAGSPLAIENAATEIALFPLEDAAGLGSISGRVVSANLGETAGTLVVAGSVTGAADFDGAYTIFNVPAGDHEVRGYAQGLQIDPATAKVAAGMNIAGVDLNVTGEATSVVSGKIEIVNAPGTSGTSVILVVEDTFNEAAARGEAPRGLRVGNVSGDFKIEGVPQGKYVVLAAFENDGLVRDPDTSIGGTDIVHIEVGEADLAIPESFKVTGALAVQSPGAETIEEVSGTPTFVWEDDSSEGGYELRLFDALGNLVWEDLAIPEVSGSKDVTLQYGGSALTAGMIYQFRVLSMSKDAQPNPISATEDLRGVFIYR